MARLTYKNGFGKYAFLVVGREITGNAANKLAQYENMGDPSEFQRIKSGEFIEIEDVYFNDTVYQCSICKEEFILTEGTPEENYYNFCPRCGVAMLKHCPYCGNTNVKLKADYMGEKVRYYIDCEVYACNRVQVQYYDTPKEAIEAWNSIERTVENG